MEETKGDCHLLSVLQQGTTPPWHYPSKYFYLNPNSVLEDGNDLSCYGENAMYNRG